MIIELELIKDVIDSQVKEITQELEVGIINKHKAVSQFGLLSAFVIKLHDKAEGIELKNQIWELKKESDLMIVKLLEME